MENKFSIFLNLHEDYAEKSQILSKLLLLDLDNGIRQAKTIRTSIVDQLFKVSASLCQDYAISKAYKVASNSLYLLDNSIDSVNNDGMAKTLALKFHCIISAYYTVEYLLNSKKEIKMSELYRMYCAEDFEKKGELLDKNAKGFTATSEYTSFSRSFNAFLDHTQSHANLFEFIHLSRNPKEVRSQICSSRFLLAFKYQLLQKQNTLKLKPISLIGDLSCRDNIKTFKKFLDSFSEFVTEMHAGKDNCRSKPEKLLYEYYFERLFHPRFIKAVFKTIADFSKANANGEELENVLNLKEYLTLPNVFSQGVFFPIDYRSGIFDHNYCCSIDEAINKQLKLTFPVHESVFFILLFEKYKGSNSIAALREMKEVLERYITNNYDYMVSDFTYAVNLDYGESKKIIEKQKAVLFDQVIQAVELNMRKKVTELLLKYGFTDNMFLLNDSTKANEQLRALNKVQVGSLWKNAFPSTVWENNLAADLHKLKLEYSINQGALGELKFSPKILGEDEMMALLMQSPSDTQRYELQLDHIPFWQMENLLDLFRYLFWGEGYLQKDFHSLDKSNIFEDEDDLKHMRNEIFRRI